MAAIPVLHAPLLFDGATICLCIAGVNRARVPGAPEWLNYFLCLESCVSAIRVFELIHFLIASAIRKEEI